MAAVVSHWCTFEENAFTHLDEKVIYVGEILVSNSKFYKNDKMSYLKGPPLIGGNPSPKTAPMSPSSGVCRIPS